MLKFKTLSFVLLVRKLLFIFSCAAIVLYFVHAKNDFIKANNLLKDKSNSNLDKNYLLKKKSNFNLDKSMAKDFRYGAKTSVINVEEEMEKLNREKVPADDSRLVQLIRNHFIEPPSKLPYNLSDADKFDTSLGQAPFVDNRLRFKEGGFYVESGAHDGEYLSNTLFFERTRHWTGVLIEPLPDVFKTLHKKHRKAYSLNACLSPHPYPSKEYLSNTPVLGKIMKTASSGKTVHVQCFPLYSVLLALNRTNVDFLSLDVEGVEHSVLETLPWNKVNIKMLAVEFDKWPGGSEALCNYMKRKEYECAMHLRARGAADTLFLKR